VLDELVGSPSGPRTVALTTDRSGRPISAATRDGDVPRDDLVALCRILVDDDGSAGGRDVAAVELVVVTTWRPGRGVTPSADDTAGWFEMLAATAGRLVHLVDWLLVDPPAVTSIATVLGRGDA
jgi:hypothetical protein